jgi:serine/threonine protein kinase
MGIVYEGRDPNLDRHVAIKTVKVENLSEEAAAEYEARFRTEARSAARLQHPNIVSVYDSDRDGDVAFLVMEYIQGDDLKHHLDKGVRYSLEQSLKMIRDLLSALDYAHRQGIIHRDIKPANLLIEPGGRVKLTDFGVARIQDSGDATRTQGTMVGTLKYMSPEQVQGQKIDARADLFSVGVVLYQLLTDKRPFDGENDFSIIHQIIGHTPPPPSSFNARLPPAIDAVVARALAKDREQRFASARDFAAALQSAMRRAEDATVIPPADPSRKSGAGVSTRGGSESLSGGGNSPTGGSTVTQELELVYWKDIKDAGDPEELQDFLAKFPAGIYADLARRRLRKLSSSMIFDSTLAEPEADDLEATRLREPTTPPDAVPATLPGASVVQPAAAAAQVEAPPTAVRAAEAAALVPVITGQETVAAVSCPASIIGPAASSVIEPETVFANTVVEPQAVAAPAPAPGAHRRPAVRVMAALAVVAVTGIAALLMMTGKGGGEQPLTGPAGAVSATASVTPIPVTARPIKARTPATAVPDGAARPVAASGVASVHHPAASLARRPNPTRSKVAASAPVVEKEHPSAVAPAPVREAREEARPASLPGPNAARGSPVDVCKDKMFLTREFCLAEQCEKPGARNHPLCIKRREDAKLREESRIRN